MRSMIASVLLATSLAACGSSTPDAAPATTAAPVTTQASTTTEAPTTTVPAPATDAEMDCTADFAGTPTGIEITVPPSGSEQAVVGQFQVQFLEGGEVVATTTLDESVLSHPALTVHLVTTHSFDPLYMVEPPTFDDCVLVALDARALDANTAAEMITALKSNKRGADFVLATDEPSE